MQIARVVIVRVIVDGVLGVIVDVHIGHDEVLVFYVAIFVVLHPPSVTVNCVDCYRKNHCKLCTKFFVRFMPQINRRFTDYTGFPVRSMFSPSLW